MAYRPADVEMDPPRDAYFHGTRGAWEVGQEVVPRRVSGEPPTNAPLVLGAEPHEASENYAYVTRRYLLAWAYAHKSGRSGEPVVLFVRPQGTIEPDPEHSDHMYAYRCDSALVRLVDESVPISAEVAEQAWKLPAADPAENLRALVVERVEGPGTPARPERVCPRPD